MKAPLVSIFPITRGLCLVEYNKFIFLDDAEEKLDLNSPEWEDIHVITGALKMFFRELPEPIIPFILFDEFIAAVRK